MFRAAALLLFCACVTTRSSQTCDSFADYDLRAREQLDALMAEAPGETLVKETARLNAARRACARHVISGFLERREDKGLNDVQLELDALAATYGAQELDALIAEALGDDARPLLPLIEEARQRTTRVSSTERHARRDDAELAKLKVDAPDSMGAAPEMPATLCAEASACAQVDCIIERAEPGDERVKRELVKAAQPCLDATNDAAALSSLATSLKPWAPNGALTETLTKLEGKRRAVWPSVEEARAAGKIGLAAQLAAPFADAPAVSEDVAKLRVAALTRHRERARAVAASPEATWLQQRLIEAFGGEPSTTLTGAGRWDTARWRCPEPKPELPTLPRGLDAKLNVRCETPPPAQKDDSMRTFELRSMNVQGTLSFTCAGKTEDTPLRIEDPTSDSFPSESFRHELEQRVPEAVKTCGRRHQLASTASCTELRSLGAADIIRRFVDHARFTHRWEPCFAEWFVVTEGAQLPSWRP